MRIAYLNTQYPSLSHTFIEREIAAVRREGIEVSTFSIRRPDSHGTLGAEHAAAAAETSYILGGRLASLARGVAAAARSPRGALRALLRSQRLSGPGVGPRLLHAAYAIEGLILARMLDREGIRHVHVHMANNGAAVALLACAADPSLTYSLTIHGSAEFFDLDRLRIREKADAAVFVRCISNFCRAQVMIAAPVPAWDRLLVVHCGIDPERFKPLESAPPTGRSATPPPLRLLAVGRLHPIKAYALLLSAVAQLDREGVPVTLDLVGDGPQRKALEAHAARLGIESRVQFSGAVSQDHIADNFNAADVFVVSSLMEGVPVVLMEAMACGKAVVATRVGGIPELVEHGVSGILTDPGSSEALASAIRVLAADPDLRQRMGVRGRARVEREFDIHKCGRAMAAIFRERVAPHSASSPSPAATRRSGTPTVAPVAVPGTSTRPVKSHT